MGIKRIEKIRNEETRAREGVANISEKIRQARLRWLRQVDRKKDREICSNDIMEDASEWRMNGRKTNTEVECQ